MRVNHRVHGAHEMFGVMRRAALINAGKKRCPRRADSIVLARLALLGKFIRVEQFEFFNRDHNGRSSRYLGKRQVRAGSVLSSFLGVGPLPSAEWWDASLKGKILFPDWRRDAGILPLGRRDAAVVRRPRACHVSLAMYVLLHSPKLGAM